MTDCYRPKRREYMYIITALMMLAMVPELISANKKKILTAKPEISTLAGMRSISKYSDGTLKDLSTGGMRVGTGPSERRIAVCKPAFTETVTNYTDWTVTDVTYSVAGTSAILSQPLMYWSDTTPLDSIYSMEVTTLTDDYLVSLFQTQLESSGNYARTTGVYLSGESPLQSALPVNLTFTVTVEKEQDLKVEALNIQDTYSGTKIFTWRSSFRGYSDIYVNNERKLTDQFTVANQINRNTIWTDWMTTGTNEVFVKVKSPDDITSIGTSNILTFTR